MAAQLRPTRLDVTDRFPMLGFTIRTDSPPRIAEVVIATDPALFTNPEGRSPSNFYASREHGLLSLAGNEVSYVVPPDVLARFVAADRLWFGLATASSPTASDWSVDVLPSASSPYISLAGLSERSLRRVRMFPTTGNSSRYSGRGATPPREWAGDRALPGASPSPATQAPPPTAASPGNGTATPPPAPADLPYDDGFGPLPPLDAAAPSGAESPAPADETAGASTARAFEVDPDTIGIEGPVLDEPPEPQAMALGNRPRALTAAEYGGVGRIMPSPAYTAGRRGQEIDRIVIHITGAPQSPHIGSWFAREEANTSAHYMVDQNGAIIQFVREQDTAWHAGRANRRSIGIEHVAIQRGGARYPRRDGSYQTYPHTPPTDAEYRASAQLVAHLCRKYGLTPDRTTIVGHREADPRTTHTVCPDGAWDWDAYMALVAQYHAALPATGTGGVQSLGRALGSETDPESRSIDGPACSEADRARTVRAGTLALTGKEYDRVSRIAPSPAFTAGRSGQAIERIVIHITDAPTTSSTVSHFTRADANSSAHYLVGQDGEIVQFVSEDDTAWHARGSNRNSIGIEHVAVKEGGATYGSTTYPHMPPTDIQYSESSALVAHLCDKYGLTPDRTTIIGHREADPNTTHTTCPDGAWDWDHFMHLVTNRVCEPQPTAQGLAGPAAETLGGGDMIEIKYRIFIPAPVIEGPPLSDDFGGDGRSFSYDAGTSRGEIVANVELTPGGGIGAVRTVRRFWGESTAYDSDDTFHVSGKPDWWLDKRSGATPTERETLAVSDDNLRIYRGTSGTFRSVFAMTSNSSVATIVAEGALPLLTGAPDIDADLSIYLKREGGEIKAKVIGTHDGFPCHELYVNGLRIHHYDPVDHDNGPSSLFGSSDRNVDTDWRTIPVRAAAIAQALGDDIPLDPGIGGMSIGPDALEIGDIIISTTSASVSQAIRAATGSEVSHAMLYVGQGGQVIEAIGEGVVLRPLEQALADSTLAVAFRVPGLDDAARGQIADAAAAYLDLPYNYLGIVNYAQFRVDSQLCDRLPNGVAQVCRQFYGHLRLGPGATDSFFCSQLVLQAFADVGRQLTTEAPHWGTPEDIATLRLKDGVLAYVGHLKAAAPARTFFGVSFGTIAAAGQSQALGETPPTSAAAPPEAVDDSLGAGTALTRETAEKNGRRYDLAQLAGMVMPEISSAEAMPPLPGERVVLDDWPYIEGPSGRTQAGVAIDWQHQSGAVGNIAIAPIEGQVLDGWTAAVRADIARAESPPERSELAVRVTTTFSREGEEDQVAVSEAILKGDGRTSIRHGADGMTAEEPAAAGANGSGATGQPQLETA